MIKEALDLSHGTANDDDEYAEAVPGAMQASLSRAQTARPSYGPRESLCDSGEAVGGEDVGARGLRAEVAPGTETLIRWVEAPRSKGLALVCIAPRDKIAVIVVRGTENARNVVQALKVWPRYRPEVCVRECLLFVAVSHPCPFLFCWSGRARAGGGWRMCVIHPPMRTHAYTYTSTQETQPRTRAPSELVWSLLCAKGAEFGVGVHAGYAEVADELYEALHQEMHGLIAKDTAIHVTGHSMGGAVSLILAMRLVAAGYLVSQVLCMRAPWVWGALWCTQSAK